MSTCAGTNQDGSPCQNPPTAGSKYCHLHQDQANGAATGAPTNVSRTFLRMVWIGVTIGYLIALAVSCGIDDAILGA